MLCCVRGETLNKKHRRCRYGRSVAFFAIARSPASMASTVGLISGPSPWRFAIQLGSVVGQPGFAFRILPNERFQWQIDSNFLVGLHERRARLGITEDQELGWSQLEADLRGSSRMINACKYCQALSCGLSLEPFHRLFWPIAAGHRN